MRWLRLLAAAGVVCFLFALGEASAQSAPGAPDGLAAVGRVHSLHVTWKPPATDGGSPVTSYVLRYISSAARDKSAENWTVVENLPVSANPAYTITGLIDEHAYDLEVRAVNAGGEGAWAAITSQETLDNPGSQAGAPTLALGSSLPGSLSSSVASDFDMFKLVLTESTKVFIYSTGEPDVYGVVCEMTYPRCADGEEVTGGYDDDSNYLHPDLNFAMLLALDAGTYYLLTTPVTPGTSGLYTVGAVELADPGSTTATATALSLPTVTGGDISSAGDVDYFSLTLSEETYIRFRAMMIDGSAGLTPTLLTGAIEVELHVRAASFWSVEGSRGLVTGWARLGAGTHHLKFTTAAGMPTGEYALRIWNDTEYADLINTCTGKTTPQTDPLYGCQWTLSNTLATTTILSEADLLTGYFAQSGDIVNEDINVEGVWATNKGAGINIAVVDTGMDTGHEDLTDNLDATRHYDYHMQGQANQIFSHGTLVAGVIAARDNDIGVRGVAPRATIYSYNLIRYDYANTFDLVDAMTRNLDVTAISNNSWGFPDTGEPRTAEAVWEQAVRRGVEDGYGGKGIFYTWAAGNGDQPEFPADHSNLDGRANFYAVTAACAIGHDDRKNYDSERGANLWVCAPVDSGYTGDPLLVSTDDADRYAVFGSTSGATAVVSGVAALVRAANNELSWREVKLILAASARKNDPTHSSWADGALRYGSATDRYSFSHRYGFGAVDAGAAVTLAGTWTKAPDLREVEVKSAMLDEVIADGTSSGGSETPGALISKTITVTGDYVDFIEFVELEVTVDHTSFRDLEIKLQSPSGAVSTLAWHVPAEQYANGEFEAYRFTGAFRFGASRHLGEHPRGAWTLTLQDKSRNDEGKLQGWRLKVYGHGSKPGFTKISSIVPGAAALNVFWDAIEDIGGSAITSHTLRYIRSDAADKADSNWTEVPVARTTAPLSHVITGLAEDVKYDVQVRGVNAAGDGSWSESVDQTTASGNTEPAFADATAARSVAENTAPAQDIGDPVVAAENDGDSLTYTLGGTDASSFAIVEDSGQLQTKSALDFEAKALYSVIVSVSDSKDATGNADTAADDTIDVTISVTNADEAGALSVPGTPRVDSALSASLSDPDGAVTSVTWTWESSSDDGNTWTTIAGATTASYTPVAADLGRQLRVTAAYTDPQGAGKSAVATLAAVEAALVVNHQPAFSTDTATRSVAENTAAAQNIGDPVEATDDDNSDSLTYTLGGDDASSFAIVEDSGQLQTRSALDFETKAMYSVTVSVSDSKDAAGNADTAVDDTIDVTISVTNVNEQPAFSTDTATRSVAENTAAGENIGAPVEATDDDDGDSLTYTLGGDDASSFAIVAASGQLQTRGALDFETKSSYSVTVSVSDGKDAGGNADTAVDDTIDVTISVTNADEAGALSVPGTPRVDSALSASLSDPDGAVTSVTWTWESSSDGNTWTTIAGATTASYTPVATDLGRQLRVTAAYTDPQGAGKSAVATLAAVQAALVVNDQPAFSTGTATRSVAENTAAGENIGAPVAATDDDDGDSLTYTLGGDDASSFAIVEDSGQLQTRGALDFETKALYSVIVSVSDKKDAGGNADTVVDDTIDVTINVTNVNDQPAFSTDTATRSVAENTAASQNIGAPVEATDDDDGDALTYSISGGTDAASFAIVAASGQLQTRSALDFETKALYSVIVSVSDSKDADGTADTATDDTIDVTISVTNADEAGALSVPGTPRVDSALSASLSDPDGAVTSVTWTWESSSDGNTWTTIAGATTASYTPVAADLGRQLRVTAAYTDPQGAGKSAVATLAAVEAALVVNHQPAFSTDTATRSVAENTAAAQNIGDPVEATDDDNSDSLTYTLGGDDAASFAIVEDSGQLQTRSALDFETKALYSVIVSVSDKKDAGGNADTVVDDTIDVTISVTNVNEQPAFSTDTATRSVAENTASAQNIGAPVAATDDDDGDSLTYTISGGTDAASFEIVAASGQLQTRGALDFETKALYSVIVSVSDSKDADGTADTAADDTIDVTISVTNADEAGALSVPGTPRVDSALSASLFDPDGAVTSVTWTWESSSDGNTWTTIAGATTASYTPVAADLGRQLRVTAAYTDPQGAGKSAVATLAAVEAALVVNHQPAFSTDTATRSVAENTAAAQNIGDPVEATDDDNSDSLTYTLGGDDAASFAIVAGSGQLQTRGALDFETKALYSVIVSVSDKKDAGGNADTAVDDTIDVTISVTNVNEQPAFSTDTATRSVAENTAASQNIGAPVEATDDDDGDALTYSISGGTDAASFAIVAASGQLQTKSALDFETKALYSVIVSVSDSKDADGTADTAADDTIDVTISVTNTDEAGALSVPGTPRVDSALSASLSDPDGAVTSVTWTWESSPAGNTWTTIAGATTASYTPVAADLGRQLRVTAAYTDPQGAGKSAVATLAAVQAALVVNHQPAFADTMTTRSVAENTAAAQNIGDPVEAGDDDGDSLAYTLGGTDASSFAIVEDSGQLQTRGALDFETKAMYSVTVSVSDRKDAAGNADTVVDDTIDVTISVTNVNEQPAFSTDTATRSVAENTASAQNIGAPVAATDDDDGDSLTYTLGGTDASSFAIVEDSGQLQTKSALDFEAKALYSVIVSVSDSKDATGNADTAADDTIDVTISVTNADEAGALSVPGTPRVDSALSASLSDPDGAVTSVTWTWESSSDDGNTWTTIAGATTASYTPVAADLGRQLRVTAAYTDPQGAGKSAVATLAAVEAALVVNHQPAFSTDTATRSVAENTAAAQNIGDPVEATDDDNSDSLTYTLGGDDASSFAIVEDSGQLQTRSALDFETKAMYSVTVSVSDSKDAAGNADTAVDDTIDVTISVTNVNEQPAFSTDTATRSVAENTAAGENIGAPVEATDDDDGDSLTYTLGGDDASSFAIVAASGQLQTRGALDFETKSSYSVTVSVSDGKDAGGNADTAVDDTIDVTISVTNADEAGALSVPGTPRVDSALSASLSDPDGAVTSVTWTWESSSDGNTWTTIAGATTASYTPVATDLGRQLRVTAAYTDPQGAGKSAVATLAAVQAALVVNDQPAFSTGTATRSVAENTAAGENIGAPVAATDDDDGDSLTYTLGGDDASSFAIVEDSGQLQTRGALDFETKALYSVIVSVSDKKDAGGNADTVVDDTIDVTINVTNVNDQPAFSTDTATRSVAENTAASQNIGAPVEATDDDDGDALTYSISGGTDAASFAIVAASGQLQTRSALDFETKALYSVIVSVSDSKDADGTADTATDDTIDVTISVTNADEAGALSVPGTPRVDSALSASLSDPDGAVTSVTWTWESSSDGNTWTTIAGATTASYTPVAADLGRQLRVTAAYTDPQGAGKSAVATLAAVEAALVVNHQPAFSTDTATRSVAENTAAAQNIGDPVEATDDDNSDSLTYTLGGDDAASFAIVEDSGQLQTRSALDFETKALYSVIVSVSDKKDAGGNADTVVDDTIDVTISVTNVNEQPAFSTDTATRSVAENTASAQNIGAPVAATDDDDGDSLTYTISGGTDAASFEIVAASGQLQTRGALDFETKALYSVIVSVSDSKDADGTADTAVDDTIDVTISVTNADEAGALSVPGTPRVDSALSASLSDPDGAVTSVTWTWESSSDGNTWTTIAGATTASYTPVAADLGRQLRVTAAYTDPQGAGKSAVATLAAVQAALVVNHQPAFSTDTATRSVAENTAAGEDIGAPVEAGDDDDSSLTYTLGGTDASSFEIVAASGQLQTRSALDFETKALYSVTVSVSDKKDSSGNTDDVIDATVVVTITVADVNERPTLTGDFEVSVPEHGHLLVTRYTANDPEGGPLTWFLSGSDDDEFELTDDGDLRFRAEPDFERPADSNGDNIYRLGVWVTDGHNTPSREVLVTVTNVDEPGSIALTSVQPQVGTPLTASLSDPDGAVTSVTWTWESSSDGGNTWTTIAGATSASYTPVTADLGRQLRVTAAYTDPQGAGKSAVATLAAVEAALVVNHQPAFSTDTATRSVAENTGAGEDIGAPVEAGDDDDSSLTYTLGGTDASSFAIVEGSGQLQTRSALDFETKALYSVTVSVSDRKDADGNADTAADDTIDVTISVTNVNEQPAFSTDTATRSVAENTAAAQNIGDPVEAGDDDGDSLTYTLGGDDAASFAIVEGSGQLQTRSALDFETKALYSVTVSVSDRKDADGNADTAADDTIDVTISVTNVNDQPAFSTDTATRSVAENTAAGEDIGAPVEAGDDDGDSLTYTLGGDDAASFAIVAGSGQLQTRGALDFETKALYSVIVSVSDKKDAGGNADTVVDDTIDVTISVTNVNERPTLTGDFEVSAPEHGDLLVTRYTANDPEGGPLTWLLSGSDDDDFELTDDGDLRFLAEPDFERPADSNGDNIYRLGVWVSDGHNTPSREVFVTVTNVDERGSIALTSVQPQVGTPLTATLTDPDGGVRAVSWQWQSSTDRTSWVDITSATGASYTPMPADEGTFLRVTSAYDDNQDSGKTAETVLGVVRAAPASNTPPAFPTGETGQRTVSEDAAPGQPIGDPVGAVDDDPGDTTALTYSLDRAAEEVFDIVPETGQLLTAAPLNYEHVTSYTVTVTATDPSSAVASIPVTIAVEDVNEPPMLSGERVISLPENSQRPVATYTATDPEERDLIWRLDGRDRGAFEFSDGVLSFLDPPDFESPTNAAGVNTYLVTIVVSDGMHTITRDVAVTVTDVNEAARGITGQPGTTTGGGGGPTGPSPSTVDFEWTVKRDIEALDPAHDKPTGSWSDGLTLWIAENGDGADDAIYAYNLLTGERLADREFELHESNRAPRGIWSDGETVWVADSGQNRLFAYDLTTGQRLENREIELDPRNRDARAIWSDGQTMWVLDGRANSLFAYDLATGALIAEYALHSNNQDPRGLWSDGVTLWVSDHGAKRLFAYRVPSLPAAAAAAAQDVPVLERVSDEEFTALSRASNNSPRGIWADADVMYVADESDKRVYSYNMPDAIDARLQSLSLSGVDIGEFDPSRTDYDGAVGEGVTETTVTAEALQRRTDVEIDPPDADVAADGHQVALQGLTEITATVTSADGNRTKTYRVALGEAGPSASCLRGAVTVGFSLVVSEGGSVEDLAACAQSRSVTALYLLVEGEWVSYILGARDFVNEDFGELYAGGVPALTPLVARSEGPVSRAPDGTVTDPLPACLVGEIAAGFNLVVYEGGSVGDLVTCADHRDIAALYVLDDGVWVSYILGAPEFVNEAFVALFPEGLPAATPLVARRD